MTSGFNTGVVTHAVPRELEARCSEVVRAASARGLSGIIVVGRGGGPTERHGDLLYLTGHYTPFPAIPDLLGRWYGRGYGAAVLKGDGDGVLITDVPGVDSASVFGSDIRVTADVIGTLIDVLREAGLASARVGLIGRDVISASHYLRLTSALSRIQLEDVADITESMRVIKSDYEQEVMRAAARAGASALTAALAGADPGTTEGELAGRVGANVLAQGLTLANLFMGTFGPGRSRSLRRLPAYEANNILRAEDVVAIDVSGALDGYYFDISRSRPLTQPAQEDQRFLYAIAQEACASVIAALTPGRTIGEATRAGLAILEQHGHRHANPRFPALGHGLGLGFEPPWLLEENETEIAAGMCLAVEIKLSSAEAGAWFEEDVLVTPQGAEILTGNPLSDG